MRLTPTINDQDQVVRQPEDKEPVIPADVIKDHPPRLSKNMKLAMRHLDIVENPIAVSEEWKWVNGEAVAPVGRDASKSYTKTQEKKFSDYGKIVTENVSPYGPTDVSKEVCSTLKVATQPTETTNDDTAFVEALPAMALEKAAQHLIKTEGRRGEVLTDPIDPENYLDRPGMEIKTSETYMAQLESESESESESEQQVTRTVRRTSKKSS